MLAADLRAANFAVGPLRRLWGDDAAEALTRGNRVPAQRALGVATPLSTLARVFVLGFPAEPDELAAAFPTLGLVGAVELALVTAEGAPLVDLRPYSVVDRVGAVDWWIASDLGELVLGGSLPEDHVLGVGGASTTLAGLMIAGPRRRVADVGTGCGIQAMHAARQADHVVATDISSRALEFARFNAELNSISNIEFRQGNMFEPLAGEKFDQVVSNPPFVITPRDVRGVPSYDYRDGGMVGDDLVRLIVAGLEEVLQPGGMGQFLGNWEYRMSPQQADGLARVEEWVRSTDLDAWVIERERQTVEQYAETWIRDSGTRGDDVDRLYELWLDDFLARGVTGVGFGYINLRRPPSHRPTGATHGAVRRFEQLISPLPESFGYAVEAFFDAHSWLQTVDDRQLCGAVLTVAGDVTEHRHYWPGEEHPVAIELRQGAGAARTVSAGTALAAVVGACDGTLQIGAICAAVAQLLEVDAAELTAEVVPSIRELIGFGMLRPD